MASVLFVFTCEYEVPVKLSNEGEVITPIWSSSKGPLNKANLTGINAQTVGVNLCR